MSDIVLANKRKGLAVLSFSLGLCGLLTFGLCGIGSIIGIVVGVIALIKVLTNPRGHGARGFAIAGLTTNALSLLVVIAVAIPNVFMTGMARSELSAVSSLHAICHAESELRSMSGRYGSLEELGAAGLLQSELASGSLNGYAFEVLASQDSFEASATPLRYRHRWWQFRGTGQRSFHVNEMDKVREADKNGSRASADDPPID